MRYARTASLFGLLGMMFVASPSEAALVQVASRAALGGNLVVPWTAFGPVGSSLQVFQQATVGSEVVDINSSSGVLDVSQQGNGFAGDFATNDVLLLQPNPDDGEVVGFNKPVLGFGTNIDPIGFTGAFTAYLAAYDASNVLLGIVSVTGTAAGKDGGTAPFIGATSFSDPIAYVNFGLVEPGNSDVSQFSLGGIPVLGNTAINQVSVITQAVPEPAAYLLLLSGLLMLAGVRPRNS